MSGDSTELQKAFDALERFEAQAWRLHPAAAQKVRAVHEQRIADLGGTPPAPADIEAPVFDDPIVDEPQHADPYVDDRLHASDPGDPLVMGDDPLVMDDEPLVVDDDPLLMDDEPLAMDDEPLVVDASSVDDPVFGFEESDAFDANPNIEDLSALDLSLGDSSYDDLVPPQPPRPLLVLHAGTSDEEVIPLDSGAISLGRGKACGLRFKDSRASREHCRIFPNSGEWWIEDLDSANGTLVNGVFLSPNTPQELAGGEELVVGSTVLRFELATGAPELA